MTIPAITTRPFFQVQERKSLLFKEDTARNRKSAT